LLTDTTTITLLIFILALTFVTLVIFLLYLIYKNNVININRNAELLEAMLKAQEDERERLALELHDGLGTKISALSLETETLSSEIDPKFQLKAEHIRSLIEEVSQDVRSISRDLVPRDLARSGLNYELDKLQYNTENLYKKKFQLSLLGMEQRLPYKMELNIFRIVQELVNNTIKHSNANTINLVIQRSELQLSLTYTDNGNGLDESKSSDGIGLNNIKTRIAHLHPESTLKISSQHGFEVSIVIPLLP
jgi:signal transduction histidine kinase